MKEKKLLKVDFCVIGAGSAGLSLAAGASQMGAKVVLIEKGKMGGDCLNSGCVPSKAILKAAKYYHEHEVAKKLGWQVADLKNDFKKAMAHVKDTIAEIAPVDSVERFEGLGVKVIQEEAQFVSETQVETASYKIAAKFFVVATGSKAGIPPIDGINTVKYLTNENIFDLTELPKSLAIIGAGPIGMELAQAFHRLGSKVTAFELGLALSKDEPHLTRQLVKHITDEGVELFEKVQIIKIEQSGADILIHIKTNEGVEQTITASHLLVAAGRSPTVNGLGLDQAKIKYSKRGIEVNAQLRTSNKRVYAMGDCIGQLQFTHVAGHHAGIVIRNTIFKSRSTPSKVVPWVTYTDPELAHVGATTAELKKAGIKFENFSVEYSKIDRAIAELAPFGEINVKIGKGGKILGATILGYNAGELIFPWVLAMENELKIGAFTKTIAPYPTMSDISKQVAGKYYSPKIFSKKFQKIVRFMLKF